jgi:hypothetical protein
VKRLNNKQNGMSMFGFGVLLVVLVMVVSLGLRLFPLYLEHFNVKSILDSLSKQGESLSDDAIKPRILNNFTINDVTNVGRQHIKVKRLPNKKNQVTVDYEVRRTLVGNIDIVIHFVDSVEI